MKKSNIIKYSCLITFLVASFITIIVSNVLHWVINESLIYGVFCSVLVALIVEFGNDSRSRCNRVKIKNEIMASVENKLIFLLNEENKYLAHSINYLSDEKLVVLKKCNISFDLITSSIKKEISKVEELVYGNDVNRHIGVDENTLMREQEFLRNFCIFSSPYYNRLKNEVSILLSNKNLLISQGIISKDDIDQLSLTEISLNDIVDNSEFKKLDLLIESKKNFFDNYICKLFKIICCDNKKIILDSYYIEKTKSKNNQGQI